MALLRLNPDPPRPDQESVWAFPRPAVAQLTSTQVVMEHRGVIVANTRRSVQVFETSHPPSDYIPPDDIRPGLLRPASGRSLCEWKGEAVYLDVVLGEDVLARVGWSYSRPTPEFEALSDHVAFYASAFDRCTVDGEVVVPQPGAFYGGWITSRVANFFKGVLGSDWW